MNAACPVYGRFGRGREFAIFDSQNAAVIDINSRSRGFNAFVYRTDTASGLRVFDSQTGSSISTGYSN